MKQIEDLAKEPKKLVYCYSCAINCTRVRYHYAKSHRPQGGKEELANFDICPSCFLEQKYDEHTTAIDFVKIEDPNNTSVSDKDAPWSDDELLLLLEGLEIYDDNWNKISDHVGSRTREECVVKFLQLEIEDRYLEPEVSGHPGYYLLDTGRVPFSQRNNPVMSVMGFLAGMTEPAVAAAAAGRSVKEMEKSYQKRLNLGVGGPPANNGQDREAMKVEDSMDVDNINSPQADDHNQIAISAREEQQNAASYAATTAFATSAARAAALASDEEREMTRLVSAAVNTTLQKFELKLQQFSDMEALLQAERRELERGRQQLFLDRLAFRKRVLETQEALRIASMKGGEEGAKMSQNVGLGGEEKLGFQQEVSRNNVGPIAPGNPAYKNFEI